MTNTHKQEELLQLTKHKDELEERTRVELPTARIVQIFGFRNCSRCKEYIKPSTHAVWIAKGVYWCGCDMPETQEPEKTALLQDYEDKLQRLRKILTS